MGNEWYIVIGVLVFFFGLGLLISVADVINRYLDKRKDKRTFKDIISIPSGEILKINQYDFNVLEGKSIAYNNEIRDWTVNDSSYIAYELRKTKPNC